MKTSELLMLGIAGVAVYLGWKSQNPGAAPFPYWTNIPWLPHPLFNDGLDPDPGIHAAPDESLGCDPRNPSKPCIDPAATKEWVRFCKGVDCYGTNKKDAYRRSKCCNLPGSGPYPALYYGDPR
jgi:hypothetical protein